MKGTPRILSRDAPDHTPANPVHNEAWISELLINRGIKDPHELDFSLQGLPSPDSLPDIDVAVQRMCTAIEQQQRLMIVGDYDCDGATSTALAVLALRAMGAEHVDYCLPNRFVHGYGLSSAVVDEAITGQPDLIITVDNGTSSVEGIEHAHRNGIDVVVTDHHLPGDDRPQAVALVNPRLSQSDGSFPSVNIAGVGVIFFVMAALRRALAARDWFESKNIPPPNMARYLDLVAVGTVADVVPLDGVNRILVMQGIKRIRAGHCRPGILALLQAAKTDHRELQTDTIGFRIAPRLNAAGRLDDMRQGVACLLADDIGEARTLAAKLDQQNSLRRQISTDMTAQADAALSAMATDPVQQTQSGDAGDHMSLCLYDERWHEGVIGILAGRFKDKHGVPVVVFSRAKHVADAADNDGNTTTPAKYEIKGSARSIDQFHIVDAFKRINLRHPGLLNKFGGHAKAAGLTLAEDNLSTFRAALDADVRDHFGGIKPDARIVTDGALPADCFHPQAALELANLAPWGQAFPMPVFDNRFCVTGVRVLRGKHLKLQLAPLDSADALCGGPVDAIFFSPPDELFVETAQANGASEVLPASRIAIDDRVRAVFELKTNTFRERTTAQLNLIHLQRL